MKKGIEYADDSWNPYHGCEMIGCAVGTDCWAYKRALMLGGNPKVKGYPKENPFKPIFEKDKLDKPLKRRKPTRFDTCFMGDIGYATQWDMNQILDVVKRCPQHIFYFLTKQPQRVEALELTFPENAWVGVTVNEQDDVWRIGNLKMIRAVNRWISFEPLYSKILVSLSEIDWIVIGALTNPEKQPEADWVIELMRCADYHGIPVFVKPNLTVVEPRMELPEAIRKTEAPPSSSSDSGSQIAEAE